MEWLCWLWVEGIRNSNKEEILIVSLQKGTMRPRVKRKLAPRYVEILETLERGQWLDNWFALLTYLEKGLRKDDPCMEQLELMLVKKDENLWNIQMSDIK